MLQKYDVKVTGNLEAKNTLVFAHGFGSDQTAWRYIIPGFSEQYRIVLFNLPGSKYIHNEDFDQSKYNSLWDYSDDFQVIFRSLQLENVILIAHSVSCMIGALTAIKHPNMIEKLVFIAGSPCYINKEDYIGGISDENAIKILSEMADNYTEWIKKYSPIVMSNPDKPHLKEEFSLCLKRLRPDIAFVVFNTILKSDYRREIALLNKPVLIIQPQNDVFVPVEVGEYLHKNIKNSQYYLINASGHFPHLSNPSLIIEEIEKFLIFS